jgi:hypothetical protein
MVFAYTKNNKTKKEGELKLHVCQYLVMVPSYAQKQPKKRGSQIVQRLGDGARMHLKTTKKKRKKKGGVEALPLLRLGNGAHLCPKEKKKPKKGRTRGIQASLLLKLSHGATKITKKMKKREASSLSTKSWQ